MREKKNVMPEIGWSQLQHRFTPGFEDILDVGVNNGWYDANELVEALVFCWVFIPWLQRELDAYHDRLNNTAKQADRNKILVPNDMYEHPGDYGVLDFKIKADPEAINQVRSLCTSAWGASRDSRDLLQLLAGFRALDAAHQVPHDIDVEWGYALTMAGDAHAKDIDLKPVVGPSGSYYMGGVNSGVGLGKYMLQLG
ncbi:hypothetical protein B0H14DRAFT_3770232 [Mycena olivaceomarginata]|nr:hypothetical protein B0H14DRAFT_3770232 [Mycena olivaceomarginata]